MTKRYHTEQTLITESNKEIGRRQLLRNGVMVAPLIAMAGTALAQQGAAPSVRSNFAAHTLDMDALEGAPLLDLPFSDGVKIRGYSVINEPNCQVIVEDFFPGSEFEWQFPHDEIQYCISGSMEVTVWSPPLYGESQTVTIVPGTVYNYPIATRKKVKVLGDEPCRHLCFCPPSPNYPFPTHEDLVS